MSTAALAKTACSMAEPGYMPVVVKETVVGVTPCPIGTYGPDSMQCVNCTDGLTTQSTASTAPSDCTAPPGHGWYENGVGDDNPITTEALQAMQGSLVRCPSGSWKVSGHLCWLTVTEYDAHLSGVVCHLLQAYTFRHRKCMAYTACSTATVS
jgi:hypothetical protein